MITTDSIKTAATKIAQLMEESADELNAADGLLGDGDLGITMVRGFREIIEVRDSLPDDVGMALFQCAKAFTKSSGSSYGTLLATGLMSVAKKKKGQQEIQVEEISALLNDALDAMKQRGKAELGDKTVLDVIAASSQAAKDQSDGSSVLKAINDAVTSTIDEFRSRQSKIGRARIFSEKSIGLDDPGMLAFRKMLEALS
ncbi:MAG: dihydroxyacetone kinase subunit L [SAR324 cluster bacterium]|jgi:dihydroxyacetone kinase-like protein|nr:dihydroxyacetone kinase subunit L [SAR324 cluster bacterium]MEC7087618.1 dihydroxyacetone kinase subunit L [SAR324 cluster bacterium]MEC7348797.1 dihydroxyacetone kinase subunit L [SAR324 cluster bacterium]MEC7423867.1 dihydroxyacetone kinase subunit L [SAR324 cluster bacterium]GIR32632.1 MAG: DAK2 domain-containing protein [Deltaproteobacteria bacterium]|tara:strand:- start:71 stop:670 length:600 start_codon:yes stop_codon:yes gene_type:complete